MTLRSLLLHPVSLGLAVAGVLAIALSAWFSGQARQDVSTERQERQVIVEAMALAELAGRIEAETTDTEPRMVAMLADWVAQDHGLQVRVVRLSGARLLASNFAEDSAEAPPPRRLQRNEKALFDLGQVLRAAVETNRQEGVFRKKQVDIERLDATTLRVTLPFSVTDEMVGIVQVQRAVAAVPATVVLSKAVLAVVIPLLVMFVLIYLRTERSRAVDHTRPPSRPWLLYGLAALLFVIALSLYGREELGQVEAEQLEATQTIGQVYVGFRQRANQVLNQLGMAALSADQNRWDVDYYQRPFGILAADGSIRQEALQRMTGERMGQLQQALLGNGCAGLLLLSFLALGYGRRLRQTIIEHRDAYLYVSPAILGMLVLVFFPFTFGIVLSFTDQTIFNVNLPVWDIWVGFKNYIDILGDFNVVQSSEHGWLINYQNFYWTLLITICWTVCNVAIGVSLGMALAFALNTKGLRFKAVYRVLLILPWAIPNYITALIWKGMFHQQFGVINQAIQMFGGTPVAWFDGVFTSFLTGIATNGWLSFPFMMVVILGALQSISADMYEAARVEGATRWQQFVHITLPLLKPTLIPAVVISVVWTFNMFNIIYLVSGGEPAGSNEILITEAYKIAFEKYQYGYAAAYSVVVFMILLVYGVFQTRVTRATEAAST